MHPSRVLETVDRSDIRMIERSQNFRFALEAGEALRVTCERFGENF